MRVALALALLAVLLGVALVVTGCAPKEQVKPAPEPAPGPAPAPGPTPTLAPKPEPQILNLDLGEEPPNLDSGKSDDAVSFVIMNAVQEGGGTGADPAEYFLCSKNIENSVQNKKIAQGLHRNMIRREAWIRKGDQS